MRKKVCTRTYIVYGLFKIGKINPKNIKVFHYRTICYENHDKQVVAGHWTFQY